MATEVIPRGEVPAGEEAHFLKIICPPSYGENDNPDPQPVTRTFRRGLTVMIDLPLPPSVAARVRSGRDKIDLWIIEDPDAAGAGAGRTFPSPTIRTVEGDVVHVVTQFKQKLHTIHWHGIDPTPMNDGVGHTSFESTSQFPYQFATNTPGTFVYHCHKNTVLHFEMGLYGLLIVDPKNPDPAATHVALAPPFGDGGPGVVSANLAGFPQMSTNFDAAHLVVGYDAEAIWAVDSMDSTWHELGHDAFMQECDLQNVADPSTFVRGILNDFRPDVFTVSGIVSEPTTPVGVPEEGAPILAPPVALTLQAGQTGLIRLVNADYLVHEVTLGVDALVVGADGYPFGTRPGTRFSRPFLVRAGTPFRTTSARRFDLLVRPTTPGDFPCTIKFYDWIRIPESGTPVLYHTARTVIRAI